MKLPSSVQDALSDSQWKEAMKAEFDSSCSNKVWTLEELSKGTKPLKGKWHFDMKHIEDGSFKKRKARFVAKGLTQLEGRDSFETYSPTARMSILGILLNLVEEDIYMEQPEGFEVKRNEGNQEYCWLWKSLYGLKQSGRNRYLTLKLFLDKNGFRTCINDKCLFVRGTGDELCVGCVCGWMICFIGDDRMLLLDGSRRK